ncbi:hypothetical protein R6Q59_018670 [Mikania micrantha]
MLESIHINITVNASNGIMRAHRAVLAARSPVFHKIFSHDLKEKELSTINILGMSIEACEAFLLSLYSNIENPDFLDHRLDLLRAADKYEVLDLKEACHESLVGDIDTNNVLVGLQTAHLYHLSRLKSCCMQYLVKFGKIYEIQEEFKAFIQSSNREFGKIYEICEVFDEVIYAWKDF